MRHDTPMASTNNKINFGYVALDLWASLVSTIFKELRCHVDGDEDDSDKFNELLRRLELAGELRAQANENLSKAREAQHDAQMTVEEKRKSWRRPPKPNRPAVNSCAQS